MPGLAHLGCLSFLLLVDKQQIIEEIKVHHQDSICIKMYGNSNNVILGKFTYPQFDGGHGISL